ncbi:MAG: hypothetical protein AABZ80_02130 [Gemmatimonadota bacterium]
MMALARRDSRPVLTWRAAATAALTVATLAFAQASAQPSQVRGSRYIATTDWMNDAVARLRSRGYLAALNPITQPWTRDAVARALAKIPAASLDTMPRHVSQWIRLLRSDLGPEFLRLEGRDSLALGFVAWGSAVAATSPRVDPYFPIRKGTAPINGKGRNPGSVWPSHGAGGWAERGPFAMELRVGWDLALRRADPDGVFPQRSFDVLPDNEVTYVSARTANAAFVVGRLRRNWAPVGTKGLMLSDAAIGIPQLGYEVGGRNLILRGFVGELDTLKGRERYVAAHRLEYVRDNFAVSIGESKVYGSSGGPRIVNLNPLEIFFITGDKLGGEQPTSTSLDGQFWLRRGRVTMSGETFVDDIWVVGHAPLRAALSTSALYMGPAPWLDLGIDYRVVLSFTYWTPKFANSDQMSYHGRGLGDNASDYDRVTLHANIYPGIAGLRLTPTLALQRKGEWDFRRDTIPDQVWRQKSQFLQGIAERTTRLALAGRYQPNRRVFAEWDAGANLVRNADHVAGLDRTEFSAMLHVGAMWSSPSRQAP